MSLDITLFKKTLAVTLAAVCLAITTAGAQVESLTPDQVAGYEKKLSELAPKVPIEALSRYMTQLARQPVGQQQGEARINERTLAAVNAVRVAQAIEKAQWPSPAKLAWHVVPPLSPLIRLHDRYPLDGRLGAELRIAAAQDEFEPASFTLYAYENLPGVQLTLSEFKTDQGRVFPAAQLDMKVVKVWYQNRNAWFSYFADVGLTLIPELLVNDENLVRVDTQRVANYARVRSAEGEKHVWISSPQAIDVPFNHYDPGFADAETLQPVSLEAGRFKQFFLTAQVTEATAPGIYRGQVNVTANGVTLARIPAAVRVLPFKLPRPATYYDTHKPMMISVMNVWPKLPSDHPAFEPTLRNVRNHNVYHLAPNGMASPQHVDGLLPLVKQFDFDTELLNLRGGIPWIGGHGGAPLTYQDLVRAKVAAMRWRDLLLKHFGHTNAVLSIGDEPPAAWIMKIRRLWTVFQEEGMKIGLAGHHQLYAKGNYLLDDYAAAGWPFHQHTALQRHLAGHGTVSHYAGQHHGPENPDFVRRQHGMLGYLSGFSAVHNYAFYYGPWNDLAYDLYKPMALAYPISNGLVDTLAWEGFREGVDDMRYATLLLRMADKAAASDNLQERYAGRKVRQWFAQLDGRGMNLHTVRYEMINQILQLQAFEASGQ